MDERIHALLISVDEAGAWEQPRGLDHKGYWAELEALQPLVERVVSQPCCFDRHVQDASFLTTLCTVPVMRNDQYPVSDWCIRFSNFGRLFTLLGAAIDDPSRKDQQQKLITLLESRGFAYVPEDALSELYDGVNPPYQDDLTWWIRYFDYL